MTGALILSGGGLTGIAWEVGVLHGLLARADPYPLAGTITEPDLVVGTSAGSVVAAHVAAGTDLDALFAEQNAPASAEIASPVDSAWFTALGRAVAEVTDPAEARRRIGAMAVAIDDPALAEARRRTIAARLPGSVWPTRPLLVTAVDVDSGDVVVFDRTSGVALADAVRASCAVPGLWPVVEIDGRRYMDGGAASITHATLAAGHDHVLVVAAMRGETTGPSVGLADEVRELRCGGTEVTVIGPDPAYLAGPGATPVDPAGRTAAAEAGHRFGRRTTERPSPSGGGRTVSGSPGDGQRFQTAEEVAGVVLRGGPGCET